MCDEQKDKLEQIKAVATLLSITDQDAVLSADTINRVGDLINDLTEDIKTPLIC